MFKGLAYICWIIVVLMLASGVILLTVNLQSQKPQIEAQITTLLHQKVRINGDIDFGLLGWRLALVLHKVEVGESVKADTVALTLRGLKFSQGVFVQANGLKFKDRLLGNYDIPVNVQPNGFEVYPLEGGLEGSAFAGNIKYIDGKLHIDGVLKDLSLDTLAEDTEGKLDARINLEAKGDDGAQLIHSLTGRFTLTNGGGKLSSKSLAFWSRGLVASLLPGKKEATNLNCAIVDFNIENGVAHSRAIVVDTGDNTVFAKGDIALDSGKVDMVLKPNPKDMQLVSVATPVHITGSIDHATVTPQVSGVVKKVGGMLLGVVNPALALIPILEGGMDEYKGSCAQILKEHQPKKL